MDTIHLIVIVAAAGIIIGGVRLIYCGHHADPDRRRHRADRRREDRHSDRRTG